jgi:hypothetical protein
MNAFAVTVSKFFFSGDSKQLKKQKQTLNSKSSEYTI